MDINKIVSDNYQNLDLCAEKEKNNYFSAVPFSNIVITNFFKDVFLSEVLKEFPDLSKLKDSENFYNKNEIKFANNNYNYFPKTIKVLFDFLNSDKFLIFLNKITSIEEELIADSKLSGGGLHEIKNGGRLKIHTDFNRHPTLDLDRRVNVLIYLNKNWNDNYGGNLELWDKDMKYCGKKILPTFNTMVIFSTTDYSNHGHPEPLNCPDYSSRKSIATYYFSQGRPKHEIINRNQKNTTNFKDRFGYLNETIKKDEKLKNYLRNLSFYKYLKNIEKKFFRTGKSEKKRNKSNNNESN